MKKIIIEIPSNNFINFIYSINTFRSIDITNVRDVWGVFTTQYPTGYIYAKERILDGDYKVISYE